MPANGMGPGSAGGTGGPGSLGGSGQGHAGGAAGGTGKDSRSINSKYTKTKTKKYGANLENLATLGTTILGGALMPGIGIGAGPMVADAMGMGFTDPQGTADSYSYDPKNTDPAQRVPAEKPKKKKPTEPLANLIGTILGDAGGTLVLG